MASRTKLLLENRCHEELTRYLRAAPYARLPGRRGVRNGPAPATHPPLKLGSTREGGKMAGRESPLEDRAMNSSLAAVMNPRTLRRLAGHRSFDRGQQYFTDGRVQDLTDRAGVVTAIVAGAQEYLVSLWAKAGELAYACTCPIGEEGEFCKHCVAVGLAWLARSSASEEPRGQPGHAAGTVDDVRAYLAGQDKNTLVEMLVEQATDDDRLRERLLMNGAMTGPQGPRFAAFRAAINRAVRVRRYVDYASAYGYASRIHEVIDRVEELLQEGHAAEVLDLAEYALAAIEEAIGSIDDSDGYMGEILQRLQDIHHAACANARPDPEALARRLFAWELRTEYDTFLGAAATYADVLGGQGLAVYRALAEAEWARVPPLRPGDDHFEQYVERFRITHIMETLARLSGDVETLVAVKKRNLSYAYAYLEIAQIYKQARRHNQALEWAEQGLQAFPQRTDPRLRDFLAEEYHRRKRHDEAMELMWAAFTEAPGLEEYRKLKEHADRTGQWPAWREKALAFIRQEAAGAAQGDTQGDPWDEQAQPDRSFLVRIFLWEGDVEAAWREATVGGCSRDLWLELAERREAEHAEDALPIYQSQIEPMLAQKNNEAYEEAVALLQKIRDLTVRLRKEEEFAGYLESIRAAHRPKRNFMKLLDRTDWV